MHAPRTPNGQWSSIRSEKEQTWQHLNHWPWRGSLLARQAGILCNSHWDIIAIQICFCYLYGIPCWRCCCGIACYSRNLSVVLAEFLNHLPLRTCQQHSSSFRSYIFKSCFRCHLLVLHQIAQDNCCTSAPSSFAVNICYFPRRCISWYIDDGTKVSNGSFKVITPCTPSFCKRETSLRNGTAPSKMNWYKGQYLHLYNQIKDMYDSHSSNGNICSTTKEII